jgi:predicted nucleic-acid-binding protein
MIGIDTNVLVRYFVDDDENQHKIARQLINQNRIYLTNIVLVESYWVMKRLYKLNQEQLISLFSYLLAMSNTEFENEAAFANTVIKFKAQNCDFADAFIGILHQYRGIQTASFDRKASSKLGFIDAGGLV